MSNGLLALFAFTPILLAAVMLIGLRWPASRAMPLVYLFTAAIGLFVWDMSFNRIIASTLQGPVITLGLLWIIFGAILLLNTLKHSGASPPSAPASPPSAPTAASGPSSSPGCSVASSKVPPASAPRRQSLHRCWSRSAFRQWPRCCSACWYRVRRFPSAPSAPDRGGYQQRHGHRHHRRATDRPGSSWSIFLQQITSSVAITHAIVGTVMPLVMVLMLTRFFGKEKSWKAGFEVLPFAIFAGLAFTLPYAATGIFLGPEFRRCSAAGRPGDRHHRGTLQVPDAEDHGTSPTPRNGRPNGWAPSR